MLLKKAEETITLDDLEPGTLFMFDGSIALKSEYRTDDGAIEAYLLRSGEFFWGGTLLPSEQSALMVHPLEIVNVGEQKTEGMKLKKFGVSYQYRENGKAVNQRGGYQIFEFGYEQLDTKAIRELLRTHVSEKIVDSNDMPIYRDPVVNILSIEPLMERDEE